MHRECRRKTCPISARLHQQILDRRRRCASAGGNRKLLVAIQVVSTRSCPPHHPLFGFVPYYRRVLVCAFVLCRCIRILWEEYADAPTKNKGTNQHPRSEEHT